MSKYSYYHLTHQQRQSQVGWCHNQVSVWVKPKIRFAAFIVLAPPDTP
ncbi:hypothetical protein [[Phormidium] sp. ETS-05]|nr:hypothetical protein [[Phormidium] sp. ETS-05]